MFRSRASEFRAFTFAKISVFFSSSFFFFISIVIAVYTYYYRDLFLAVLLAIAILISVLIHEFGHAFVAKYYRLKPEILIHSFGGTCYHEHAERDLDDFFITVAGPLLQILFGVLSFAVIFFLPTLPDFIGTFIVYFAYFSLSWGVANLVIPIFPLDGGRIFLLVMRRFMSATKAQTITIQVSIVFCVAAVIFFAYIQWLFLCVVTFSLLLSNFQIYKNGHQIVRRPTSHSTSKGRGVLRKELDEIDVCFESENWVEASRRCHFVRSQYGEIPEKKMDRIWYILGVSNFKIGDYEEALEWLRRAPQTPEVIELTRQVESMVDASSS